MRQVLLSHPHNGPPVEVPAGLPQPGRMPDGRELALLTGHRVRALAMDAPGTGYAVTGPDGQRLLYLPPGCAPAGLAEGSAAAEPYHLVLLDVVGRPDALARLRAVGAAGPATDVVAVHLDHDLPPGAETRRRLAAAGARAVPDGTAVVVGAYEDGPVVPDVPVVPRRTLVLGGARSGKSVEAERRLEAFPDVLYVATGGTRNGDGEWAERVAAHRERRPGSWRTVETCDLVPLLREDGPPLLVDCLSLWLTDAMDAVGAWDDAEWADGGEKALRERVRTLTEAVRGTRRVVVAVSNEVGSGIVPATASGRRYRDELGRLNAAFAGECEQVLMVVAGQAVVLRG
ncbi:bifunctional adenosylcobinamide kinase/adenosylcobinamide-phosphate guanylyltransferase [Streptomyces cinereospinus]